LKDEGILKEVKHKHMNEIVSSGESAIKSEQLAGRLRSRIIDLARKAGRKGLTINEAERQIEDHKGHSVSPRFAELVKQGSLVRVLIDRGKPTRRFLAGVPRYVKRHDEMTQRDVTVHWVPEFAPAPSGKCDPDQSATGSWEIEGVRV
jgi:hypothetical protein